MTTYYIHAIHTMNDGSIAPSGRSVRSDLSWDDFIRGPAKDYLRLVADKQLGVDSLVAYHVHTEASKNGMFLHKVFQPDEIAAIV